MKKIIIFLIVIFIGILAIVGVNYYKHNNNLKLIDLKQKKLINDIKSNYSKTVKTKKETSLYINSNKEFIKDSTIGPDYILELEEIKEADCKYYKITGTDYYIYYKDVKKYEPQEDTTNTRYKNFLAFDNNVIIEKNTKIYQEDGTYLMLNKEINEPLIIKEDNSYGFEYLDKLFYVDKDSASLIDNKNTEERKAEKVLTLTYHFIYDPEQTTCNQDICLKLEQFENHLKFLNENNYFIMKLSELELYLDGKINIPYNSIVLTIDDGFIDKKVLSLLEQYKAYATLFVITSYFQDFSQFESPYLSLQSHTDHMHEQWACKGMGEQGGGLLCTDEETAIKDLKTSQDKLGGPDQVVYLAYPFFDFNNHAINILKKAGFRMAFIGQWNVKGFSKPGTDKYKVPRLTVFSNTTVDVLKNALKY